MADYYPLISRAVAGLEKNNGENRRALYERARAALLAQLRGVTPPLNESDITRERLALEESIRKVEAESARQFVEASRQSRAARIRPVEPRSTILRQSDDAASGGRGPAEPGTPPRRYVSPTSQPPHDTPSALSPDLGRRPGASSSPPALPDSQQSDSIFDRPLRPEPPRARRNPDATCSAAFRRPISRAQNVRMTGRNSTATSPGCSIRMRRRSA